jgi:metallo-beta-lactamase family protein
VLTHAHLDHCGRLPLLEKYGFKGPIYATPATIALTGIVLRDSASIQEGDVEDHNRRAARDGLPTLAPLYTVDETERILKRFKPLPYARTQEVARGIAVRFFDAGHIIGSASIRMCIADGASGRPERVIMFSGDVGVQGAPLLRDPQSPDTGCGPEIPDAVLLESTYGDHDHRPLDMTLNALVEILTAARAADGKVLVPSFAIGRTQDIIYHIGNLTRAGRLPRTEVCIDSPMATAASRLYEDHPDLYDPEARALQARGIDPLNFPGLRYTQSRQESKALNAMRGGGVIIAGSGMCTGGRILHHLRNSLSNPSTHLMFVGYQGQGTLGRALVDGAKRVRVLGDQIDVRAQVHTLGGFSAHAGQSGLVAWGTSVLGSPSDPRRPQLFLTHGEDGPRRILAGILRERTGIDAALPIWGQSVALS